ncbi:MAG: PAS domain S-box protein [Burkholderiaceae bacterium]|uniref:Diguanylate cyclase n=1 Tax=Cupriavidus metallidurans TaxID=119219 RepID=A0A482IVS5_9BURK|nr:PAS domain S-box protein [Cupriavidus sp. SHE]PCH54686.1 MAG: PAS domain S-box protein [Burkholderiaceae bacterium]QBP11653.1 diguanylate cyclase [Cupriavidus metallidurans]QWC90233.1 diguanylate cyclase [Cupriavidus metallidurans]
MLQFVAGFVETPKACWPHSSLGMESYAQPLRRRGIKAIAAGVVALTALIGGSAFVMLRFDGYVKAIYEHNTAPIKELAEIRTRATDIRRLLWRLVALRGREEERQAIAAIHVNLRAIDNAWARYCADAPDNQHEDVLATEIGHRLTLFNGIVRSSLERISFGDHDDTRDWLEQNVEALNQLDTLIASEVDLNVAMAAALRQESATMLSVAITTAFAFVLLATGATISIAIFTHLVRQRDDAMEESRYHLWLADQAIEMTLDGVMITNAEGTIEKVNPAFCRLTGYSQAELVGNNPRMFNSGRQTKEFYRGLWKALREAGQWKGELWNRRKDGGVYLESLSIAGICGANREYTHFAAICTDITHRQQTEERLGYLATHDMLTGLPNRFLLDERLSQALARARRMPQPVALMFLDLDGFKAVNDTLGHGVGDELLILIGRDLHNAVRDSDTVARIGGDEFAIVLEGIADQDHLPMLARSLLRMIRSARQIGEHQVFVTSSIGISVYPTDALTPGELLKKADVAMYHAKRNGKDAFCLASSIGSAEATL